MTYSDVAVLTVSSDGCYTSFYLTTTSHSLVGPCDFIQSKDTVLKDKVYVQSNKKQLVIHFSAP